MGDRKFGYPLPVTLSVVIITYNEEANIGRTLESVQPLVFEGKGEVIIVDSGSTDRTVQIAESYGAKVFVEQWKGYAAQKNSAIDKASGDWILSLDADECPDDALVEEIQYYLLGRTRSSTRGKVPVESMAVLASTGKGFSIPRKNYFLGRWIKHGGFWPDPKSRLFRRGVAKFENRLVHEDVVLHDRNRMLTGTLIHHSY